VVTNPHGYLTKLEKKLKIDENLPIINKTKHSTKEEKQLQDGRTQVLANEESLKRADH